MEEIQSSYKVVTYIGSDLPDSFKGLIYARWLRTLRFGNTYFRLIEPTSYYKNYEKYIESILHRLNTVVRIAVLTEDTDVALGFSVAEQETLHYCHVQKDVRRQGIAKSLVPFEIKIITHLTKNALSIWNSKLPNAIFNPF